MTKALIATTCPQCGANIELDKQLEFGFCSYCGTKIIVKDVVKRVKILNQPTAENYLILANREYGNGNYKEALKNYEKYIELEPNNPHAVYKKGACISFLAPLREFHVQAILDGSEDALELLDKKEEKMKIEMAYDISKFVIDLYQERVKLYLSIPERYRISNLACKALQYSIQLLDGIENQERKVPSGEQIKEIINKDYISIIMICVDVCALGNNKNQKEQFLSFYDECVKELKKRMPYYEIPTIHRNQNGCYVATAVYGSYDAKEVWVLRRYRDNNLDTTWYGRLLIKCYYKISPTLVNLFGNQQCFIKTNKYLLDCFVKKLKKRGYQDSPYQDKY